MSAECRFDGRVAIVTGAGRGIGRAHALLLASRGARVVVNDLGGGAPGVGVASQAPADIVVDEIRSAGGEAVADYSDISNRAGADAMIATAIEAFGQIDILINNAGVYDPKPFEAVSPAQFMRTMMVHVGGHFFCTQAVWPHFTERGGGHVVMTTSGVGLYGLEDSYDYAAAKGAIVGLTRSLALEGTPRGISVNAIAPVAFTRMSDGLTDPDLRRYFEKHVRTDQISPLACWLAHEECSARGQIFGVGGGRVARVFFAETAGLHDPSHDIEAIRDSFADLSAEKDYLVPSNAMEASTYMLRDFVAS